MNRQIMLDDIETMDQTASRKSGDSKIEEDAAVADPRAQPHCQVFAMSSDKDFFWNHPDTVFAIFFGATLTILLAVTFVLWTGQQVW